MRQLPQSDLVRAAHHKGAHRRLVTPNRFCPEDAAADRPHIGFEAAVARARLPERAEGEPEQRRRKAQAANAQTGDGGEGHKVDWRIGLRLRGYFALGSTILALN